MNAQPLQSTLAEMAVLSERLPSLVASAIAASARVPPPPPLSEDVELMLACRAVGAAVDRLEQVRYTKGEISARMSLEKHARELRGLLDRKAERRHGR